MREAGGDYFGTIETRPACLRCDAGWAAREAAARGAARIGMDGGDVPPSQFTFVADSDHGVTFPTPHEAEQSLFAE